MKNDELKESRNKLGASQDKMAAMLRVPKRTYQNWEQPPKSDNHRQIPDDMADRVQSLVSLRTEESNHLPGEIVWLQVPVLPKELEALDKKASIEGQHRMAFLRELLLDGLS